MAVTSSKKARGTAQLLRGRGAKGLLGIHPRTGANVCFRDKQMPLSRLAPVRLPSADGLGKGRLALSRRYSSPDLPGRTHRLSAPVSRDQGLRSKRPRSQGQKTKVSRPRDQGLLKFGWARAPRQPAVSCGLILRPRRLPRGRTWRVVDRIPGTIWTGFSVACTHLLFNPHLQFSGRLPK